MRVTIEDDGVGFDVEKVMSSPVENRRLGLLSMQERVQMAGGEFKLDSGAGTTIVVSPLRSGSVEVLSMERLKILLAEDHRILREGLKRLIAEQPNMEVVGEADDNGVAAWQQAMKLEPDIVLMDITMPLLNGAEATMKIRELCPNVKVIALTGHRPVLT